MLNKLNKSEFLTSGTWTCPAGVTNVVLFGVGGGGGGTGCYEHYQEENITFSAGGGNVLSPRSVAVVPGTTYTITIGSGGAGGTPGSGSTGPTGGSFGGNGADTTFGALSTFKGAPGGVVMGDFGSANSQTKYMYGVSPINSSDTRVNGSGDFYYFDGSYFSSGNNLPNWQGSFSVGPPTNAPGGISGVNDYAGISGIGGNGGLIASTGTAGSDAPANSGAGGGAGGASVTVGVFSSTRFAGGAGGSGRLIIMWVE